LFSWTLSKLRSLLHAEIPPEKTEEKKANSIFRGLHPLVKEWGAVQKRFLGRKMQKPGCLEVEGKGLRKGLY